MGRFATGATSYGAYSFVSRYGSTGREAAIRLGDGFQPIRDALGKLDEMVA